MNPEDKAVEQAREAVEAVLSEANYRDLLWCEQCSEQHANVVAPDDTFELVVYPGNGEWRCHAGARLGIFFVQVEYRTSPGVVPSPDRVMRDLVKRAEAMQEEEEQQFRFDTYLEVMADREGEEAQEQFEEYLQAKAHCGPGEEPDMDEWRRKVEEHRQAERERRERLNKATGGASWGMFGGVAHPNATGTTLAYCGECGEDTSTGFLEAADEGEELSFRPIHKECLEELQEEKFEGSTLPAPDEVCTFAVWVQDRGDGEVMFIPYEPDNG